jgi:hypothetical protein
MVRAFWAQSPMLSSFTVFPDIFYSYSMAAAGRKHGLLATLERAFIARPRESYIAYRTHHQLESAAS